MYPYEWCTPQLMTTFKQTHICPQIIGIEISPCWWKCLSLRLRMQERLMSDGDLSIRKWVDYIRMIATESTWTLECKFCAEIWQRDIFERGVSHATLNVSRCTCTCVVVASHFSKTSIILIIHRPGFSQSQTGFSAGSRMTSVSKGLVLRAKVWQSLSIAHSNPLICYSQIYKHEKHVRMHQAN